MRDNFSVRLSDEQRDQLRALAKRWNVKPSVLIDWACRALIQYAERHKGRIVLPLDYDDLFQITNEFTPPTAIPLPEPNAAIDALNASITALPSLGKSDASSVEEASGDT